MLSAAERATSVGLEYVAPKSLPILRKKRGSAFCYLNESTMTPCSEAVRRRLKALVVPPAWTEVRLARNPLSHIQAVGRDAEGRLQYIYHPLWAETGALVKLERLCALGEGLPGMRAHVEAQLRRRTIDEDFAMAAALALLDRLGLRVGYPEYSREDGGRGATTLTRKDVFIKNGVIRLRFFGKGGKRIERRLEDQPLARALAQLREEPGELLFRWREAGGEGKLDAEKVNAALRAHFGDTCSARDFRTFRASAIAAGRLREFSGDETPRQREKHLRQAIMAASEYLANTPTVARSSYVHPVVQELYTDETFDPSLLFSGPLRSGLTREETALMRILERHAGPA